jgi:DNA repair protein RadA/Sms
MSKKKSIYTCQECGYESSGWLGKCPACNQWNSFVEEIVQEKTKSRQSLLNNINPIRINDVQVMNEERFSTGIKEMDRVLGGGIVKGSLILVGGDPGIGKSTLMLQVCDSLKFEKEIFYISGEESIKQIKIRADRLGVKRPQLLLISETGFNSIERIVIEQNPGLVIIDSIQTIYN